MSYPVGSAPDGSWQIGTVSDPQGYNESGVKSMIRGQNLGPWGNAQTQLHGEFVSAPLFGGEVARLDNRIDEILIGSARAQLATYSTSDVWNKPAGVYKLVVDVLSGATGGDRGAGGVDGGWGGGWERITFTGAALEAIPSTVVVTVGSGGAGATSDAEVPASGGASSFGTYVSSAGATWGNYGTGSRTYRLRGGKGGKYNNAGASGSDGTHDAAGSGGAGNQGGGNGFSLEIGQIGTGSAGGGGGGAIGAFASPGKGGAGGWPAAPGGGGGESGGIPAHANGGNGSGGAVYVTAYREDTLGIAPSTPTGVTVTGITSSKATVSWTASVDDVIVDHYAVYLNSEKVTDVTGVTHELIGLSASTSYTVNIRAVDLGRNESDLSTSVNFTTTA